MAFVTIDRVRRIAQQEATRTRKSAKIVLAEDGLAKRHASYDIFLSHSFLDRDLVLGVKRLLESASMTVYVDWMDDPELDRSRVTPATADRLKARMRQCSSLVFAVSQNSPDSKWMPWELGHFDGLKGDDKVAILPLVNRDGEGFEGQEYLGLYRLMEFREPIMNLIRQPQQLMVVDRAAEIPLRKFAGRG